MSRAQDTVASGRGREAKERAPAFRGWLSTDEDEVRRREWRGRTEIEGISALDPEHRPFGDYRVASSSGGRYVVELRALRERINSCECHDYRTNRLGTCKHIEGVLRHPEGARLGGAANRGASERIEVFLDEGNGRFLASSTGTQSSGVLRSLSLAQALVVAREDQTLLRKGTYAPAIVLDDRARRVQKEMGF